MSLRRCLRTSLAFSGSLVSAQFGKQEFTKYQHGNASNNGIRMKIPALKMPSLALPKMFAMNNDDDDDGLGMSMDEDEDEDDEDDDIYFSLSEDDDYIEALDHQHHVEIEKTAEVALSDLQTDIGISLPNVGFRFQQGKFIILYDQARRSPLVTYEYLTEKNLNRQTLTPAALSVIGSQACHGVNATLPIIPNIGSYARLRMKKMVATENHPEHQAETLRIINEALMHEAAIPDWDLLEKGARIVIAGPRTRAVHVFSGPIFQDHIDPSTLKRLPSGHQIPNAFFKILVSELMCQDGTTSYRMQAYFVRDIHTREITLAELDYYTGFNWNNTIRRDIIKDRV